MDHTSGGDSTADAILDLKKEITKPEVKDAPQLDPSADLTLLDKGTEISPDQEPPPDPATADELVKSGDQNLSEVILSSKANNDSASEQPNESADPDELPGDVEVPQLIPPTEDAAEQPQAIEISPGQKQPHEVAVSDELAKPGGVEEPQLIQPFEAYKNDVEPEEAVTDEVAKSEVKDLGQFVPSCDAIPPKQSPSVEDAIESYDEKPAARELGENVFFEVAMEKYEVGGNSNEIKDNSVLDSFTLQDLGETIPAPEGVGTVAESELNTGEIPPSDTAKTDNKADIVSKPVKKVSGNVMSKLKQSMTKLKKSFSVKSKPVT